MTTIFVYGTLKTGEKSNHLLAGQRFIGPAQTTPIYRLYGIGWHPGLVLDKANGLAVQGELWFVDEPTLAKLDEYEGLAENYFRREAIAIAHHFGEVQAYFFNGIVPADAMTGDHWPLPA